MIDTNLKINKFLNKVDNGDFKGYSVYDAFNAPFLKYIGRLNIKIVNVIITQLFKKTPFNIRSLFGVKKSINPKSLGLILKAKLLSSSSRKDVEDLYKTIMTLKNNDFDNLCWGYNWDYYTLRGGTFPKHFPNAIVTYFIGDAFIDYYIKYPSDDMKKHLLSMRKYFLEDINRTSRGDGFCFSYSSVDTKEIYNASALISRYLYRIGKVLNTDDSSILKQSISYLIDVQNDDGSWYYGYNQNQEWVDSFHSEYMLEFFEILDKKDREELNIEKNIENATNYYLSNFYFKNVCNYFPENSYPINIHSVASRIIYLSKNNMLEQAKEIINWSFTNLYNSKRNQFYFEKTKFYTNKNYYHRWNQSWMYLALSEYKKAISK